jgi:LysM repeat protein
VLFLGLSLTAALAGVGVRRASGQAPAVLSAASPAPVVAYLRPLAVPQTQVSHHIEAEQKHLRATPAPTPAPTPSPTPAPTPFPRSDVHGFPAGRPAWYIYEVESGDNLWSLAAERGMCPDHILWNNPGRDEDDRLLVGDELVMPGVRGIVYTIREGDDLRTIAARFSTTVEAIASYPGNGIERPEDVVPGKTILLPDGIPNSAFMQDDAAARAYTQPSDYGYIWPFYGPITTYYGEERPGYVHNAIDIGGLWHYGAPVLAVASGIVHRVGLLDPALGNYVIVAHADGSRSVYAHLEAVYVEEGQTVGQAQPLGALGCTGHSTGTHLHFELWRDGRPVDPLAYLP